MSSGLSGLGSNQSVGGGAGGEVGGGVVEQGGVIIVIDGEIIVSVEYGVVSESETVMGGSLGVGGEGHGGGCCQFG